ncbi:MAG: porin family protein [Mariprofundus sp.]
MKRFFIGASMIMAGSVSAQAQDIKIYDGVGLGVFGIEATETGFSQNNTMSGGYAKLGVDINDYFGLELRAGTIGTGSRNYPTGTSVGGTVLPVPVEVKLTSDYFVSYLAKFQYPVSQDFRIYTMLGATTAKFKRNISAVGASGVIAKSKTGFSYGVGGDYSYNDRFSFGGEWMQYWTNVTIDSPTNLKAKIWGATASVTMNF